ncbi:GlyGly-CTERM sorting domain-containing protein [Alteromonadaceae bacterium M269]|nr:GlyGly-CTERM sorting domain-containing protein [Alteromonadaceae bacterium M269]
MNMKKSALALAVCSGMLMTSAVTAQDKYNLSNKSPISGDRNQAIELNQQHSGNTWLVKVNVSSLAQRVQANPSAMGKSQSVSALASINSQVSDIEADILALGLPIEIVNRTSKLASALVIRGEAEDIQKLGSLSQVVDILPVYDFKASVDDSAVYMNATPLVTGGIADGSGIRVAVLDTGIDYTHAAIGGEGTAEAYAESIADPADTPAWPIGNVIGGFDFINNDPDPTDLEGHGTHVAHSVLGIAPEASIYAYTVCNENRSCPGAPQLMALEAAMDPNGDGDISDRVDVINMSLGGDFGTSRGGAVADLLNQAARLGVVSAISAGNDGPTPFIVGGPSTTDNVLSVGAMTHPTTESSVTSGSFGGNDVQTVAAVYNPDTAFSIDNTAAELVYPDANQEGCAAFADGTDFSGQAVLIDRGTCSFVDKTNNAQAAGAEFVVVANNREGAPFRMSGDGTGITINSVMISQADGDTIKTGLESGAVEFNVSSEFRPLVGAIASFTSRGPSIEGRLKPEITAPGVGIITAQFGQGDGLTPISGTSFSSPMTAGSLALLSEALPDRNAFELKATIMNAANLDVTIEPRAINPDAELAPISYIGSGLVDVEKAVNLPVAAWATDTRQAALAFGYVSASSTQEMTKNVTLKNFSNEARTYTLSLVQRYANDMESGALSMDFPDSVTVPAGQTVNFDVTMTIDPSALHPWTLDDSLLGSEEGSVDLTVLEYDGALNFSVDGEEAFHLVYHVLPKAIAKVTLENEITDSDRQITITNTGSADFSPFFIPLTINNGINEQLGVDFVAGSIDVVNVPEALCTSEVGVVSTFVMRDGILSPNIAGFFVDFDLDSDGVFDFTTQSLPQNALIGFDTPGITVSFTRRYNSFEDSVVNNTIHTPGNNDFRLLSCIEDFGLTTDDIGGLNATVAFRVEDSAFIFTNTPLPAADMIATEVDFAQQQIVPRIVDADGEAVSSLAAGESAFLIGANISDVIVSSGEGNEIQILSPTNEAGVAPVVAADQVFDIDENTENGTEVGTVQATDVDLLTSPVSEIFVEGSSSNAFSVSRSGVITVANQELLDFDAGFESATLDVVAIDTQGNISEPATVTVNINNLVDSAAEMPPPPPAPVEPPRSSGGGATGLLALLLLPLTLIRRRKS